MSKNEKEVDLQVGKIIFQHPAYDDFDKIHLETLIKGLKFRVSILERKVRELERRNRRVLS